MFPLCHGIFHGWGIESNGARKSLIPGGKWNKRNHVNLRNLVPLLIIIAIALFLIDRGNREPDASEEAAAAGSGERKSEGSMRGNGGSGGSGTRSTRVLRPHSVRQTTGSGLQYEILEEGEGESPGPNDRVKVHYHGTLEDGTVFDSSIDRGQPAVFPLNAVIAGWTEGLQLMKPGAKYCFIIPPDLAYGDRGAGEVVPAGATLKFEVELISVEE